MQISHPDCTGFPPESTNAPRDFDIKENCILFPGILSKVQRRRVKAVTSVRGQSAVLLYSETEKQRSKDAWLLF